MSLIKVWKDDDGKYRAPVKTERKHYTGKRPVEWTQPLLTSNDAPDFGVWGDYGNNTWYAFSSRTYNGRYITKYGNEYSTTLYTYMDARIPIIVTGISLYIPTVNSDMNWGSIHSTRLYGSNDASNWVQIFNTGNLGQDRYLAFDFTNSTEYRYYQYQMTTYGSGHRDRSSLSCFVLTGYRLEDYDYYEDVDVVSGFRFY